MIAQYRLQLTATKQQLPPPGLAYRLYAWLLEQVDSEYGMLLHEQGEKPVSQYIQFDRTEKSNYWVVNLLSEEAIDHFAPILEQLKHISLHEIAFSVEVCSTRKFPTTRDLLLHAKNRPFRKWEKLQIISPTTFRQNGRYTMFPQEQLLLHSLIQKWNAFCGDYPLDDDDAIAMMIHGISIEGYRLKTLRYPIKQVSIPGFCGELTLEAHLSAPMQELWKALLVFSQFSGVGVKTTLGMGNPQIK